MATRDSIVLRLTDPDDLLDIDAAEVVGRSGSDDPRVLATDVRDWLDMVALG